MYLSGRDPHSFPQLETKFTNFQLELPVQHKTYVISSINLAGVRWKTSGRSNLKTYKDEYKLIRIHLKEYENKCYIIYHYPFGHPEGVHHVTSSSVVYMHIRKDEEKIFQDPTREIRTTMKGIQQLSLF